MGNHQSIAIDNGPRVKSASQMLPNTQQFLDYNEDVDPLRGFNLAPPSAAVIGAGIAGVHAAYELGKLGFQVTVFEEKDRVAAGETQHSLPFVGVGLIKPSLARVSLREELLKGFFPASCPSIIARDHIFNSLFSSPLHRWVLARTRGTAFNEDEIMYYTDNLSRLSHQTVNQLAAKHPALQQHIRCSRVSVGTMEDGDGKQRHLEPATTAHRQPMMVDPVGWTRSLAGICEEKYKVRFALGERLESFHTYLKYNVETTRSIRISKPDPADPKKRMYADETYDVIVLATGANTGAMTSQTCRLPIVGLSGVAVTVENAVGSIATDLRRLFSGKPETPAPVGNATAPDAARQNTYDDAASLVLLSGPCNLFGYHFLPKLQLSSPPGGDANSPVAVDRSSSSALGDSSDHYTLSGLMSLDTTQSSMDAVELGGRAAATRNLLRMEAFLRVMCDQELPLVECLGGGRSGSASSSSSSFTSDTKHSTADVGVVPYTRAFTPDGVPIVDHCGGAFNTFVCSGFGDQAMDFAPGSAKILGQLVKHQAELLLEEDAQRQKAVGLAAMAAGDERGAAIAKLPLPPSRIHEVEYDIQMLLNGKLPTDNGTDKRNTKSEGAQAGGNSLNRLLNRLTGSSGENSSTDRSADADETGLAQALASSWEKTGKPVENTLTPLNSTNMNDAYRLPIQSWRTNGLPRLPTADELVSREFTNDKGETMLYFCGNPFSTNRFRGLVKKGFRDLNVHSPTTYLDAAENAFFAWADPIRQRINREATKLARYDNVPITIKTFIYNNMYFDGEAEERLKAEGEQGLRSRQRVLEMRESQPGSGAMLMQQSIEAQAARERRAREASVSDLRASPSASPQH